MDQNQFVPVWIDWLFFSETLFAGASTIGHMAGSLRKWTQDLIVQLTTASSFNSTYSSLTFYSKMGRDDRGDHGQKSG